MEKMKLTELDLLAININTTAKARGFLLRAKVDEIKRQLWVLILLTGLILLELSGLIVTAILKGGSME